MRLAYNIVSGRTVLRADIQRTVSRALSRQPAQNLGCA